MRVLIKETLYFIKLPLYSIDYLFTRCIYFVKGTGGSPVGDLLPHFDDFVLLSFVALNCFLFLTKQLAMQLKCTLGVDVKSSVQKRVTPNSSVKQGQAVLDEHQTNNGRGDGRMCGCTDMRTGGWG